MQAEQLPVRVAAVCVYHSFIENCPRGSGGLRDSGCRGIHRVSGGPLPVRATIGEIRAVGAAGAEEIDVVITRGHVLTENWRALYDEVRAMRDACGDAPHQRRFSRLAS